MGHAPKPQGSPPELLAPPSRDAKPFPHALLRLHALLPRGSPLELLAPPSRDAKPFPHALLRLHALLPRGSLLELLALPSSDVRPLLHALLTSIKDARLNRLCESSTTSSKLSNRNSKTDYIESA